MAEAIPSLERSLFLDNERFDECSSCEERLVCEQGKDKVRKPHVRGAKCLMDDEKPLGMRGRSFICVDAPIWGCYSLPGVGVELGASSFHIKTPPRIH